MSSIFTKIINKEIDSYILAEDNNFISILDINPIKKGHSLVIPKIEVDYIFDLDDKYLKGIMLFAKKIADGIKKTIKCNRVGISVIGLEIPHCHLHLIPIDSLNDMNFCNKINISKEGMCDLCYSIRKNIAL